MAPATRRTLSKVKSSATTARQPSVPNLMEAVVVRWLLVVGRVGLVIDRLGNNCQLGFGLAKDQRQTTNDDFHTSFFSFFSSRYFTTLPTSCAFSRVVTSNA